MPPTCGLWFRRNLLVAVSLEPGGRCGAPLLLARTDDARQGLLEHLVADYGQECALVAPEGLLRVDPIGELALRNGFVVWCVPHLLFEALRSVTGLAAGPPKRSAMMLAHLPFNPFFRPQLRHYTPPTDGRQLSLL